MNPILQMMQQLPQQQSASVSNPMSLLQQFSQFKNLLASRGQDPKTLVNLLMQSGKMSPQQFQQLQQQAAVFKNLLK